MSLDQFRSSPDLPVQLACRMARSTHAAVWLASRSSATANSAPSQSGTVGRISPTPRLAGHASSRPFSSRPTARYDTADRLDSNSAPPSAPSEASKSAWRSARRVVTASTHDQPAPLPQIPGALRRERLPRPRPILGSPGSPAPPPPPASGRPRRRTPPPSRRRPSAIPRRPPSPGSSGAHNPSPPADPSVSNPRSAATSTSIGPSRSRNGTA